MAKHKIAVLRGGNSPEREISLKSGAAIAKGLAHNGCEVLELDPADYPGFAALGKALADFGAELVFIGLHGGAGEDGEIQAALAQLGFRHTGSGFKACAITMDKYVSKLIAQEEGVPVPDYIIMRGDLLEDYNDPRDYEGIAQKLGLPLIVKPNDAGSSVGISKVETVAGLKAAVKLALRYSGSALLERFITGSELTVTVLDGKALPLVEIRPLSGWYDYQNKYKAGKSEYLAPAPLEDSVSQLVQLYAERLWQVFGLSGYARIDFRFDGEVPYFLEVNTLPGMTSLSLTPMAAKCVGMSFEDLIARIVELGLRG